MHGFLNYLARVVVRQGQYTIIGYKGKQVRDQLHAQDVVRAAHAFAQAPRPGEVYNLGGGRENGASVLECIDRLQQMADRKITTRYEPANRRGDHICYITDLRKFRSHYPSWNVSRSLDDILEELLRAEWASQGGYPDGADRRHDRVGAEVAAGAV